MLPPIDPEKRAYQTVYWEDPEAGIAYPRGLNDPFPVGMMTDGPQSAHDPVMAEALDWVLKVKARPDDPSLRTDLISWLATSEANAKAFRKAERVWQLTGDAPPAHAEIWAPGAPALRQGRDRPQAHHGPPKGPPILAVRARASRRKVWLGLASAACAAGIAVLLLPGLRLAALADYSTGSAESRVVRLADGSVVTLAARSALAVRFTPDQRNVELLSGEAFFEVAHDATRPFQVQAAGLRARDIGTAFDIDIEPGDLQVAVQSGMIGVSYRDGDFPVDETLTAGERLRIDRSTGRADRGKEPPGGVAPWRTGNLVVEDVSVSDVVQRLRRYFPGYIWLRDGNLGQRRISGVYDLNDPVSALKAAVEPHAGVVTEVTPFLLVISAR